MCENFLLLKDFLYILFKVAINSIPRALLVTMKKMLLHEKKLLIETFCILSH